MKISLHFLKTERMQVVLILLFILGSGYLTVRFVMLPQREMAEQNRTVREQMAQSRYASLSTTNMQVIAEHELASLRTLSNEWARISERLSAFPSQAAQIGRASCRERV